MVQTWEQTGGDHTAPSWQEAHAFAAEIIADWPRSRLWSTDRPESPVSRLLALLTRLGDAGHIATFLAEVVAAGASTLGDNPAIVTALGQVSLQRRGGVLVRIIAGVAETAFGRAANLLSRAASTPGLGDLHAAARSLLGALPGEPTQRENLRFVCRR